MYKDITTHSKQNTDRSPRVLENETNGVKFRVHKHIYYGNEWLLTCRELGVENKILNTEDMGEAKERAIIEMIQLLGMAINKYQKAIADINGY